MCAPAHTSPPHTAHMCSAAWPRHSLACLCRGAPSTCLGRGTPPQLAARALTRCSLARQVRRAAPPTQAAARAPPSCPSRRRQSRPWSQALGAHTHGTPRDPRHADGGGGPRVERPAVCRLTSTAGQAPPEPPCADARPVPQPPSPPPERPPAPLPALPLAPPLAGWVACWCGESGQGRMAP